MRRIIFVEAGIAVLLRFLCWRGAAKGECRCPVDESPATPEVEHKRGSRLVDGGSSGAILFGDGDAACRRFRN